VVLVGVRVEATNLALSSCSRDDEREQLLVLDDQAEAGEGSLQPAAEAVADDRVGQILVLLELLEVVAHLGRRPGVVASQLLNVLPVVVEGVHRDHGVVSGTSTESASTGVQHSEWLSVGRRRQTDVLLAVGFTVDHLGVSLLALKIGIVVDKVVPRLRLVLCALQHHGRDLRCDVVSCIASGFDQKDFVAGKGKAGCERSAAGMLLVQFVMGKVVSNVIPSTRSNDDIVVLDTAVVAVLDRLAISTAFEMRLSDFRVLVAIPVSARSCFKIRINNIHIRSRCNSQDRADEAQSPAEQHGGEGK
jgi:hypothetical protein